MTLPKDLMRLIRGPYDAMPSEVGTLLEGEGALLTVFDVDNTAFTMTWYGGRDGENKIQGGGFLTIDYEGPPQFVVTPGLVGNGVAAVVDSACNLWVSSDGTCSCAVAVGGSGSGVGSGSGIGTGSGIGSGIGYWCKIAGCGAGGGTGGGVEEIDTEDPILGGPITAGQTGTIRHAISGVTPGTYTRVAVNEYGHVTDGDNGGGTGATTRLFCNYFYMTSTSTAEQVFSEANEGSYSYDVPAGTLSVGDALRVRAWGSFTGEGTAMLYCGGTALASATNNVGTSDSYSLEFELLVIDSTTLSTVASSIGAGAVVGVQAAPLTVSDLSTNALTIELTGFVGGGGNTIAARGMAIWKE